MFSKKDLTNIEGIMMLYAVKMQNSKRHASRYLNVSLDTLDKYIRMLEDEVGTKLIIPTGKGCQLTLQGEEILRKIDFLKQCIQNIYIVRDTETEVKGEVRVAYDLNMRGIWHTQLVRDLFNTYPNITLCADNVIGTPEMKSTEYDIILSYERPKEEDLVIIASREIPCKFFASLEYLKTNSYPKDLRDLILNHRLILRKECWKSVSETSEYPPEAYKGISFSNSEFIVEEVVANSGGVAMMPYYIEKTANNLVCLNKLECQISNTLYLISHKIRKDIPKVRVVLNYYKDIISTL